MNNYNIIMYTAEDGLTKIEAILYKDYNIAGAAEIVAQDFMIRLHKY